MKLMLWHESSEHGPYDLATVEEYIATGQLSPKMLARLESESQWKPLSTFLPKPSKTKSLATSSAVIDSPQSGRRRVFAYCLLSIVVLAMTGAGWWKMSRNATPKHVEIYGSVFVRSAGGETFKLSLVPVAVFSEAEMIQHSESKLAEVAAARQKYDAETAKFRENAALARAGINKERIHLNKQFQTSGLGRISAGEV